MTNVSNSFFDLRDRATLDAVNSIARLAGISASRYLADVACAGADATELEVVDLGDSTSLNFSITLPVHLDAIKGNVFALLSFIVPRGSDLISSSATLTVSGVGKIDINVPDLTVSLILNPLFISGLNVLLFGLCRAPYIAQHVTGLRVAGPNSSEFTLEVNTTIDQLKTKSRLFGLAVCAIEQTAAINNSYECGIYNEDAGDIQHSAAYMSCILSNVDAAMQEGYYESFLLKADSDAHALPISISIKPDASVPVSDSGSDASDISDYSDADSEVDDDDSGWVPAVVKEIEAAYADLDAVPVDVPGFEEQFDLTNSTNAELIEIMRFMLSQAPDFELNTAFFSERSLKAMPRMDYRRMTRRDILSAISQCLANGSRSTQAHAE